MATRVIQNRYYGYDFGSRQPCSLIETKLTTANVADFDNLDRWLSEHLRVDLSSIAGVERREADGHSARASDILNRSLALYGELVRGAGIPSFEHGQVLRLAQLPGEVDRFGATLALPVVDRMPLELFARIFQASLLVITTRLAEEPTAEAVQALFAELDQDIVQNAKRFNPFEATGQTICKLAQQRGTPWRHIGRGVVRLGWGARSKLLYRSSIEQDSAIGAQVSGSKRQSVLLLKSAGFPAPEHELVGSVEAATEAAQALGWPVVVKPENAARAEGVTIDVTSAETLRAAFATARELSEDVLVERQVPGLCHRIAVAGDKIIYVVKRIPRGVTGDGRHTIRELAAKANAELQAVPPWQRLKEFLLNASRVIVPIVMVLSCLSSINTDGGNMSGGYIHGLNHIVEGVRQMRGTADVQVPGAGTCLVTSGPAGHSSALVLRRDA